MDNFNHLRPMNGFVIVHTEKTIDRNRYLATVLSTSLEEQEINVDDILMILLDDECAFEFGGKHYHRIKKSSIIGKVSKVSSQWTKF